MPCPCRSFPLARPSVGDRAGWNQGEDQDDEQHKSGWFIPSAHLDPPYDMILWRGRGSPRPHQ